VVASRHHCRIWKAAFTWNGQPVWIGAGTHDIGFEKDQRSGKVTHKIDPAVDGEPRFIQRHASFREWDHAAEHLVLRLVDLLHHSRRRCDERDPLVPRRGRPGGPPVRAGQRRLAHWLDRGRRLGARAVDLGDDADWLRRPRLRRLP